MTVYTNTSFEIYDSDFNETITVAPLGDATGIIEVKASDNTWGAINFTLDFDTATALANAILKQVAIMQEGVE